MRKWLHAAFWIAIGGNLSAAVPIVPSNFSGPKQPQVCMDDHGKAFVVFGRSNSVFCVVSTNYGRSFTLPAEVASLDKLALGMRRGPRIIATQNGAVVSAISSVSGNLSVWTSVNTGNSWREAGHVNDVAGAAREGLHAMASDGKKKVFLVWLDLRNGRTEIWGSLSENEGKTWQENFKIYSSPDGTVCECCHPSVIFTQTGEIFAMWRNWLNGSRDMYFAMSRDGKTFGKAQKMGTGTWPLKGCPMDGGALAVSAEGRIKSIWRRENSIFTADSLTETKLGTGTQPIAFRAKNHTFFVWQHGSKLVLQNDNRSGLSKILAEDGRYPAAASGNNTPTVVVWETSMTNNETIVAEIVE